MDLSSVGGFTFEGKHISNKNIAEQPDILLLEVERDATADLVNVHSKRLITVTLGIYGLNAQERKQKLRALLQEWLSVKGKLIFDDDSEIFYLGEITDKTPVTNMNVHLDAVSLVFECERDMYGIEEKIAIGTSLSVVNGGNEEANTIFECTQDCVVMIGSESFELEGITRTVYVDSKRMVVYSIVDGKEVNEALKYKCTSINNFLKIPVGGVNITSTASIKVIFRDTYKV